MLPNFNKDFTQPDSGGNFGSLGKETQGKNPQGGGRRNMGLNLTIAILILALSLISYIGLFSYSFYLDRALAQKTAQLTSQKESFGIDIINNIIQFSTISEVLNTVFENRLPTISFLDEFASIVVPSVQFSSLSISRDIDNIYNISIVGSAPDLRRYLQQLNAFRQNDVFRSGLTTSFNISAGQVSFTYSLSSKLTTLNKSAENKLNVIDNRGRFNLIPQVELRELDEETEIEEEIEEETPVEEVLEEEVPAEEPQQTDIETETEAGTEAEVNNTEL